jgi:hypothetical protein
MMGLIISTQWVEGSEYQTKRNQIFIVMVSELIANIIRLVWDNAGHPYPYHQMIHAHHHCR